MTGNRGFSFNWKIRRHFHWEICAPRANGKAILRLLVSDRGAVELRSIIDGTTGDLSARHTLDGFIAGDDRPRRCRLRTCY